MASIAKGLDKQVSREKITAADKDAIMSRLSATDDIKALASCDLVISACTSVAHLAGAMGVETWVITPIMPYFLWAIDGEHTPYYHSVRLFRQAQFGTWQEPFDQIRAQLDLQHNRASLEISTGSA